MHILFPHQLVPDPPEDAVLIEHPRFFTEHAFHVQKLVLHRASMQAYRDEHGTGYIGLEEDHERPFREHDQVRVFDPVDHALMAELEDLAAKHDCELVVQESPLFMAARRFNREYFADHSYYQLAYYRNMRRHHAVLVTDDGEPVGGKWSFDPENREQLPEDMETPEIPTFSSQHVHDALDWVRDRFPDAPGTIDPDRFRWPTTRDGALTMLDDFLEHRLEHFGAYQDAIEPDLEFGFHSLLSSSINIGLITPEEVIERTLAAHDDEPYPMNSLEGFIRQIMGWREFVRAMYQLEPGMRDHDLWDAGTDMPEAFYTGQTGLQPVDAAIDHVMDHAYTHHIERLMVLGNVMLLLEVDPDQVYDWFMEVFIDAYDWVMVPNIYGMSQYAYPDMMTKPYISSSNYIRKMSHYDGGDWEDSWDGLYWTFIERHQDRLSEINRMGFMLSTLERMGEDTMEEHREDAAAYRSSLGLDPTP